MISHHSLIANVEQTAKVRWPDLDYKNGEKVTGNRWIGFLPLYHAYGQLYANLIAAKFTVPIHIMRAFVYEDFLKCIQDNKVTQLQVAPPVLVMMAKRPETKNYDLSSVEEILCGAAPLGKDLQNEISRRFKCEVKQGWGMTEGEYDHTQFDRRGG
jgi:acyl-CoA synthetase (AMP-forming)/AMP-acid ligase II